MSRVPWGDRGRPLLLALTLAAAAVGPACSSAPIDKGVVVGVTLRDFHISVSRASVRAGKVTFRVRNHGPSTHEFIVDRTTLAPYALPLRKDGIFANEGSRQLTRIGSIEEAFDRHQDDLTVTLTRGHYVLYCNMEGHYLGHMRSSIAVR